MILSTAQKLADLAAADPIFRCIQPSLSCLCIHQYITESFGQQERCEAIYKCLCAPSRRLHHTLSPNIARIVAAAVMGLGKLDKRVGFIGAGQMAEALARGFISKGVVKASDMVATDPVAARRDVFESFSVKPVTSNAEVHISCHVPVPCTGRRVFTCLQADMHLVLTQVLVYR